MRIASATHAPGHTHFWRTRTRDHIDRGSDFCRRVECVMLTTFVAIGSVKSKSTTAHRPQAVGGGTHPSFDSSLVRIIVLNFDLLTVHLDRSANCQLPPIAIAYTKQQQGRGTPAAAGKRSNNCLASRQQTISNISMMYLFP
ncbi:unnamed protein product [Ceratitis capitata]|uniref:(Mediterranean fruit fly) hypothetical protein n=1 Tax=Ceratitis capitata TaxID=7213 RepID=A0A811UQP1_CERCA|nr:unnamed protein product [Ceratitis capitata]